MELRTFKQAENFLYSQIPSMEKRKFPGEIGLIRTKYLMKLLENPQEKVKVIHLAGTSGKGSTAYLTSHILQELGFKTGLSLSPHLIDIRERFQVNGKFLKKQKFVNYVNQIIPIFEKMKKNYKYGAPTYFELVQAIGFCIYEKEKVDYAIIETGMGGTYDASNVVKSKNKVCVITRIGLDHTRILGSTLAKIVKQKVGIIQKGNPVLALKQRDNVNMVINKRAKKVGTKVFFVNNQKDITTSLKGDFQKENAGIALAVVQHVSKRDKFDFDKTKIINALNSARFPGRFDIRKYKNKTLIIDGAHNPQKMKAFIRSLKKVYPNEKFTFLVAFKKGKKYKKMFSLILDIADKIYVTRFFQGKTNMPQSEDPEEMVMFLKKEGFKAAFVLKDLDQLEGSRVVVTGSLYLAGETYELIDNC